MKVRKEFTDEDLSDRRKLFEELLPEWEGIIASLAYGLLSTRTIDRGLVGIEDIQNQLRETLWRAIEKYERGRRGAKAKKDAELHTWITKLLKQECSLIVEAHYNKVPRDGEGHPMPLQSLRVVYDTDNPDEENVMDVEDPRAEMAFDELADDEWFRKNVSLIFKVLKNKKSINEKLAFAMLLSGRYESDREIAEILDVNFAKVGEVRFKAKLVFALIEGIPIDTFTTAQNAEKMAVRMRHLLRSYVDELPKVNC